MSTKQKISPRWTAKGFKFKISSGTLQPEPTDIVVMECPRSVSMDKGKYAYGQFISANLAITLIHNLHKRLFENYTSFFKLLNQRFTKEIGDRKTKEEQLFSKAFEEFQESIKTIIDRSAAITIDKNIILKTLSQPECEGMRFYLCIKSPIEGNANRKDYISLVTVGVDKTGQDLFYKYKPENVGKDETLESLAVDDQSATGEYGHPPGTKLGVIQALEKKNSSFDNRFVLLKYAIEKIKKSLK